MSEPLIICRDLAKRRAGQPVFTRLNWECAAGATLLAGGAGAGKTTLCRMLMGFSARDTASNSSLQFLGNDPGEWNAEQRSQVAYAEGGWLQRAKVPGKLSVAKFLDWARSGQSNWNSGLEKSLMELNFVAQDQKLSGLQKSQADALLSLMALCQARRFVVLDSCLDSVSDEVRQLLVQEIQNSVGASSGGSDQGFLLTTAKPKLFADFSGRFAVLHSGRIVLEGSVAELREQACELCIPLALYNRIASITSTAGILASRTEGKQRYVVVQSYPQQLNEAIDDLRKHMQLYPSSDPNPAVLSKRALSLSELFEASTDVSSTGTGTAPE